MKKRVLVTGGAGFIGSYLCEELLNKGYDVICCDNFYTGNKDNLEKILDNKNFDLLRHDITFPLYLEVDIVLNFACPASPVHYQNDPVQTVKTCVHGAINMLGLAKRTNATIMQASTSEVYGDPEIHPQSEDYKGAVNITGPRACYDEGKRCAETIFWDYKRQHDVNIKIIRKQTKLPLIIDAGLGQASDATIAMELGCDGVLVNTAIAKAKKPFDMALAFKNAVIAGRQSFLSGRIPQNLMGSASSPLKGII